MAHEEYDADGRPRDVHDDGSPVHPGWQQQSQASYDAAYSGGWGGPGQAETGPLSLTGADAETGELSQGDPHAAHPPQPYPVDAPTWGEGETIAYEQPASQYGDQPSAPYDHQGDQGYNQRADQGYDQHDNAGYPRQQEADGYDRPTDQGYDQPTDQGYDQPTNQGYDLHQEGPDADEAASYDPEASVYRGGQTSDGPLTEAFDHAAEPVTDTSIYRTPAADDQPAAGADAPQRDEDEETDGESYAVEPPTHGPQSSQPQPLAEPAEPAAFAAPPAFAAPSAPPAPAASPSREPDTDPYGGAPTHYVPAFDQGFGAAPGGGGQTGPYGGGPYGAPPAARYGDAASAPAGFAQQPPGAPPWATASGSQQGQPAQQGQPGQQGQQSQPIQLSQPSQPGPYGPPGPAAGGGPAPWQQPRRPGPGLAAVFDFSFVASATRTLARPLFWLVVTLVVVDVITLLVTLLTTRGLAPSPGFVLFSLIQALVTGAVKVALARLFLELCVNVADLAQQRSGPR